MKPDNANIFNRQTPIVSLITLLFLFFALTACKSERRLPEPPVIIPFAVQKAGAVIETELLVQEHRPYLFDLIFGFEKNDPNDRERVKNLAGDYGRNQDGKLTNPGISVPLRLNINIIDSLGERPIFDKKIFEEEMWAYGSDNFKKRVAIAPLKAGHYRISVESLKDMPELIGTNTAFGIGYNNKTGVLPEKN